MHAILKKQHKKYTVVLVILLVAVWAAREIVERRDIIDYDAPGVDITSEGP
jgi:hypothetical protein